MFADLSAKKVTMKVKCSDHVYSKSKSLKEEENDIKDKINTFYSNKTHLLKMIFEEKNNDPSKEIQQIENEVKLSDPFRGFLHDYEHEEPKNNELKNTPCIYHSRGFCKRGLSCKFYHSSLDCRQHMKNGKCLKSDCSDRHRENCHFQNRKGGCTKSNNCAFLHRQKEIINEELEERSETDVENLENMKRLEIIITDMKKELQTKDEYINNTIKEIDLLKSQVQEKDAEILEKEAIIKNLEGEDSQESQESDDEEDNQRKMSCHNEVSGNLTRDDESESEGEFDLFQLEVVSDEEVYVCNLCDEGLDSEAEIREHLKEKHKKELKLISDS